MPHVCVCLCVCVSVCLCVCVSVRLCVCVCVCSDARYSLRRPTASPCLCLFVSKSPPSRWTYPPSGSLRRRACSFRTFLAAEHGAPTCPDITAVPVPVASVTDSGVKINDCDLENGGSSNYCENATEYYLWRYIHERRTFHSRPTARRRIASCTRRLLLFVSD